MPGFIIHIAVGKQYLNKHKGQIKDTKEFMKGIIAPDLNSEMTEVEKDKSKSHYGVWNYCNAITNIDKFLIDPKVDIKNDYWKGYFMHLLTDFYFYNIDFYDEYQQMIKDKNKFYYDYDCLNGPLRKQYSINPDKIQSLSVYMNILEEKPKYLKLEKVIKFIEKISDFDLETEVKIIGEKGMEGIK